MKESLSQNLKLENWVGFLSSFSEAFIMSLGAFLAPVLAPLVFKNTCYDENIFSSYAFIFLGSFVMYPIGAWYYGHMGDIKGRQKACTSSSLGLAIVTGVMACLPIGLNHYFSIIFIIFLALQFFFSAGEYYSSIVFSLEHGHLRKQGFISGLSCVSSVFGILLASGFSLLIQEFPTLFSWRFPFFVGLLTGLFSFIFKFLCKESPYFSVSNNSLKINSWHFLKENYSVILSLTIVTGLFYTIYSFIFLFLPLIYEEGVKTDAGLETFICLMVYGFILLLSGYFADRFKINRIMIFGIFCLMTLLAIFIPFFHSIPFITRIFLTIFAAIYIGPIHSWIIHQSQPEKRCRITATSSAFASAFFSHSCVIICMFFYQRTLSLWVSSFYIFILMFIALIIISTLKPKVVSQAMA